MDTKQSKTNFAFLCNPPSLRTSLFPFFAGEAGGGWGRGVYFTFRFYVLMKRIRNLNFQVGRLYFLWNLPVIYLCTVWVSSMCVSDGLIASIIKMVKRGWGKERSRWMLATLTWAPCCHSHNSIGHFRNQRENWALNFAKISGTVTRDKDKD